MTTDLSLPSNVRRTEPGQPYQPPRPFVFNHVPDLRELLPKHRGRPGLEYLQCCVVNMRRAQDEGWVEVDRTVIYTIEGPKGSVDMKLFGRGKLIPGQPHDSGARLCRCDKTVESLTGVWINPHQHPEPTPMSVNQETQESPGRIGESASPNSNELAGPTEQAVAPVAQAKKAPVKTQTFTSGGGPNAA